jgi:hypothetical protein
MIFEAGRIVYNTQSKGTDAQKLGLRYWTSVEPWVTRDCVGRCSEGEVHARFTDGAS